MEDRIVYKYRHVDASLELYTDLIVIAVSVLVALFLPFAWVIVAIDLILVLPFKYYSQKKQQRMSFDEIPALIIDGNNLYYNGKTVNLSRVRKVIFNPDIDYDGNILIFVKGRLRPITEIYTDTILVDKNELLKLIKDRSEKANNEIPYKG